MRRLTAVVLLGLACASPGMPPGGPPDVAAPQIVAIIPDSGTLGVSPKEVIFRFDEVVSERPTSATTLADLFLISPRDRTADASWHRDAIGVRPSNGWRANTPYTVIMLRGIADLRGNIRNTGASTFFSTGKTIPRTRLAGRVFDWVSGTPANGALVESFIRPDSLHPYIALVDSSGAFVIEHLPPSRYTVRAYLDRNKNFGIDPSEPWDSVSIDLTDSAAATLLIFAHDSVPPRIRDVSAVDSVSLLVTFDRPVDPSQTLTAANFAVIGPDSVPVPIVSAGAALKDTTARTVIPPLGALRPARPPIPSRRDTTAAKPVMPRPAPVSEAVIKLQRPLAPKTTYRVRAIGIRGLLGHTGDSERAYTTPAAAPPPAPKPAVIPPAAPPATR
ncbi:MAG: Ig-like domain-containing protein [Gemmatimonadota bacterium]|nr:Ig-like domain-containing protein [Gemmatimonadota bacterium]